MPISRAEIPVDDSQALIEKLCDAWADEPQQVRRESERVCVIFPEGTCVLYPEAEKLIVAVETLEDEALDQLEGKVQAALDSLDGETLDIVWET